MSSETSSPIEPQAERTTPKSAAAGELQVKAQPAGVSYVLVTAARNEEEYIEQPLRSVVAQTVRPLKWIIVSDGSTDRTDEIVTRYAREYAWVELVRMPEHRDRDFAAKARCIDAALERLRELRFDIIGNLDADVSFEPDYMAFLLRQFAAEPRLGVAGTPYVEEDYKPGQHSLNIRGGDWNHVSGPCQLFQRACFQEVGGYLPLPVGAIDWIAVTTARMRGWRTRSFPDKTYFHHRRMGTADSSLLRSNFNDGRKAYSVGGHPVWELPRGVYRMREHPLFLRGLCFQLGYLWACVTRTKRSISPQLMAFHRREQMARLRGIFSNFFRRRRDP